MRRIKRGDRGADVRILQDFLKNAGFDPGAVDGVFGVKTERALSSFEKSSGVQPTGIASEKLLEFIAQSSAEGTREWYRAAFDHCTLERDLLPAIERDARLVLRNMPRYIEVARPRGMPWYLLGGLHFKEASCSFSGILHNGQRGLIGAEAMRENRKSTIVPKGVGPFATWEDSARDALDRHAIGKVTDWELGNMLYHAERYNGTGYLTGAGRAEKSPYLWARTSVSSGRGLYKSDGKFDPHASTRHTSGLCAILKWLELHDFITIQRKANTQWLS